MLPQISELPNQIVRSEFDEKEDWYQHYGTVAPTRLCVGNN